MNDDDVVFITDKLNNLTIEELKNYTGEIVFYQEYEDGDNGGWLVKTDEQLEIILASFNLTASEIKEILYYAEPQYIFDMVGLLGSRIGGIEDYVLKLAFIHGDRDLIIHMIETFEIDDLKEMISKYVDKEFDYFYERDIGIEKEIEISDYLFEKGAILSNPKLIATTFAPTINYHGNEHLIMSYIEDVNIVEHLLNMGMDCSELLFYCKNIDVIKLINNYHITDKDENNALFYHSDPVILQFLIDQDVNVNHLNAMDENALFFVKTIEGAKCLIDNGIDVNVESFVGQTIKDLEILKQL